MPELITVKRHAYGAITALAKSPREPRILIEGPANTGKSSGILWWMETMAWNYPGIRILVLRQTMKSLRESILATLEDKVWAPIMQGRRHPAQHGTATRWNRSTYQYPNGTTIVIGGLEDPGWTYSMEYDVVLAFEAWEIARDAAERLFRANRNHVLCRYAPWNQGLARLVEHQWLEPTWAHWHGESKPEKLEAAPPEVQAARIDGQPFGCWQQTIFDTNPGPKFHWLNHAAAPLDSADMSRIKDGGEPSRRVFRSPGSMFTRILSRHSDNPACTSDDLAKLDMMTGARRANLRLGLWESSENQIWGRFDPTLHMLIGVLEREGERDPNDPVDRRQIRLRLLGEDRPKHLPEVIDIKWCFGSMDFGYTNAGVLQVWLVDYEDRIYRAVEIHRREMGKDWWADRLDELHLEFNLHGVVADSADAEGVVKMNDRLTKRGADRIVRGVDKSLRRGSRTGFVPTKLDLVRDMMNPDQPGGSRMYWLHDAMREYPCPISTEKMKPTSSTEEIPGYTYRLHEEGKPDKEEPDPACADDGCDATGYAAVYQWMMDPVGAREEPAIKPGSAAARLRHDLVNRKTTRL